MQKRIGNLSISKSSKFSKFSVFLLILSFSFLTSVFASYASETYERTQFFTGLSRSNPAKMEINNPDIPITEIVIYPLANYNGIRINLTPETGVSGTADTNYAFVNAYTNLPKSGINYTTISFKISNEYIALHNIKKSSAYLAQFNDKWEILRTVVIGEDANYTYYKAQTDGLYLFAIAAKQFDFVNLGSYKQTIEAGKTMLLPVLISNPSADARQYEISVAPIGNLLAWQVEGYGINKAGTFKVSPKSNQTIYASITTNKATSNGKYEFEIVVKGDETKILSGNFFVQGSTPIESSSIVIEKLFEKLEGTGSKVKVSIRNSGNSADRYFINVKDADEWADYSVDPNTIMFIDPGKTQIAYITMLPIDGLESKNREFTIQVTDGKTVLKSETFTADVISPPKKASSDQLEKQIIILAMVLAIALVIVYPLAKRKKEHY